MPQREFETTIVRIDVQKVNTGKFELSESTYIDCF
jgi:hypothetical protein